MNSLSWMIYLADLVGALNALSSVVALFGTAAGIAAYIIWLANGNYRPRGYSFEDEKYLKRENDDRLARRKTAQTIGRPLLAAVVVALIAVVFAPSSNTIYAIAASEMGEDVLNSKTGGKAIQALDAWLDRQIEGEAHD